MENKIINYCEKNGITIEELVDITGVSIAQLYLINKYPLYNVTIITINRIFKGTKKKFGKGLSAKDYLDHECLHN